MEISIKSSLDELFKNEQEVSVDDFLTRIQKLHFEYIKYRLQDINPSIRKINKFEDEAEYLIGVCTHPFIAKYYTSQTYRDGLYIAGTIFEFLADISDFYPEDLEEKNYYLLKSTLCYALSGYESNSSIISNKITENLGYLNINDESINTISVRKLSQYCILKILSLGKGPFFNNKIQEIIQSRVNFFLKEGNLLNDLESPSENLIHLNIILGCIEFGKGLNNGIDNLVNSGIEKIKVAQKISARLSEINSFFICDSLLEITNRYWNNSPWIRLRDIINNKRYIESLVRDGIKVLWTSQIEALELKSRTGILQSGYLDNNVKRVVVNMPTSAGKSLVAEILLAKILFDNRRNKCVYVVPTKALVAQVTRDLSRRFRNFGIRVIASYNDQEVANFESVFFQKTKVIVITPEKLNYLIRQESDYLLECKLFVFDEIHNISLEGRGWTYEETISLLLQNSIYSDSKMLFMSAIMPNSFTIREWVDPEELNEIVKTNWQPTRQLKGVLKETPKIRWENGVKKRVGLQASLYFARNKEDIKTPLNIPHLFNTRIENDQDWKNSAFSNLVNKFKIFGSVLIYFPKRDQSKAFCKKYIKQNELKGQSDISELVEIFNEEKLPKGHLLYELIEYGIAYHDGTLSNEIRQAIEDAYRKGIIKVLATSKTLIQGVNMPAKTFIISDYTARFGRKAYKPIDKKDFKNLLGRVGRAAYDTEGQIIFCNLVNDADEVWQNYLYISNNDESLNINSCLADPETLRIMESLCDAVDEATIKVDEILNENNFKTNKENLKDLIKKVQSYTLFQNTLNNSDENDYHEKLNRIVHEYTLAGRTVSQTLTQFITYSSTAINNQNSSELQLLFRRTGLSIQSASLLFRRIEQFWSSFDSFTPIKIDSEFIINISNLLFDIPEFLAQKDFSSIVGKLIAKWVYDTNQHSQANSIFFDYFNSILITDKTLTLEQKAELLNNFDTDIINYKAPWAFSSFIIITEYILQRDRIEFEEIFREELKLLSSYCKYGVYTPSAALFCSLGLRPAYLSLKLSNIYESFFGLYNYDYSKILLWVMSMQRSDNIEINYLDLINDYNFSEREVKKILLLQRELDDFNIQELAVNKNQYLIKNSFVPSWKYFANRDVFKKIKVGDVCSLVLDEENQLNPNAILIYSQNYKLGYVPHSINSSVLSLLNEGFQVSAEISISNPEAIDSHKLAINIFIPS